MDNRHTRLPFKQQSDKTVVKNNISVKQSSLVTNIIQPKLKIGAVNDKYEQEADTVADHIMRMPSFTQVESSKQSQSHNNSSAQIYNVQRKCSGCKDEEQILQKKSSGQTLEVTSVINANIQSLHGKGQPLSQTDRRFFEPRFGADFSQVRLHTNNHAANTAKSINAKAFTIGNNVVFSAGEYSPGSVGRKLMAHELTHVMQQNSSQSNHLIQRLCDTKKVNARSEPANLPLHPDIIAVFTGKKTIKYRSNKYRAILLIQQALADLNYQGLGKTGRNKLGVDGYFKSKTQNIIKKFQKDQGITENGIIDQQTLRCLDQASLKNNIPAHIKQPIQLSDLLIEEEQNSEGMKIFFARNDNTLDTQDKQVIKIIAKRFPFQRLNVTGFQSEDEVANNDNLLAKKRADAVAKELKDLGQPFWVLLPNVSKGLPNASIGLLNYSGRRMVQISVNGKKSPNNCAITPPGWEAKEKGRGPCDKGDQPNLEKNIVKPAISEAQNMMAKAYNKLKTKDKASKNMVKTWFGSQKYLNRVIRNIRKWKKQVDTHLPAKHLCANECHSSCDGTDAYSSGRKASAIVTFCTPIFNPKRSKQSRAETIIHETGHGAINTIDIAYENNRLISFIYKKPRLALKNTDSYVKMILCLNNKPCTPPAINETFMNIPKSSDQKIIIESLSYLERWTDWAWQDINNLFTFVEQSRKTGKWPNGAKDYNYLAEFTLLFKIFGWKRAKKNIAATTREKIFVATVHQRLLNIEQQSRRAVNYKVRLDNFLTPQWQLNPKREITITLGFFKLNKRKKVKFLLNLLVKSQKNISSGLVKPYATLIEKLAKNWFRLP